MNGVDRLGLGCARLVGGREAAASRRLVETALSLGIRQFDTAPYYGDGWSERVLGDVLHGVPDVKVTTKIGIPRPAAPVDVGSAHRAYRALVKPVLARFPKVKARLLATLKSQAPQVAPPRRDFPLGSVEEELEASLHALRRDRIDCFLIHEPDQFIELGPDAAATFERLRAQGSIGEYGLGYDREVADPQGFGTVLQSRYLAPEHRRDTGVMRVFHGVLRHRDPHIGAEARLQQVLTTEPEARILLSVSTIQQLRQLHAAARDT